jgi:dienelactone hydrolase
VPVHVFYGAADGWGSHQGNRAACRRLAGGSTAFHEYPGAEHGFDAPWQGEFRAGGNSFRFGPDPTATAAAQTVIAETLSRAWGTPR